MAIKYSNGIRLNENDIAVLLPPQASEEHLGGFKAKARTNEDLEVVVDGSTGKAYVTGALATASAKGLMAAADKSKLDGIEDGANNYVHPEAHAATMITQDTEHRFVSDAQISSWNAKAETTVATEDANGLMSAAMVTKLAGIADGANNYVHPESHAASMIVEDATRRFVSDTEKAAWNAKAETTVVTKDANGLMSAAMFTKLEGIEEGANNYVHPETHAAAMITTDAERRFVTDAQIAAWSAKADTKEDVGLGNVTNDAQVKRSEMGVAGGVATLDASGLVPAAQLPSFVDDVLEVANYDALPGTGESGKIYVTLDTNLTYRWSGTQYVEISKSLALGETDSTAYAGSKGKANAEAIAAIVDGTTTVAKAADANTVNGLTVETAVPAGAVFTDTVYVHPETHAATMITTDATHRFITDEQLTKLAGVEEGANNYVHPETHAATMIVEDTTHKFVTDAQIAAWNAKAETTVMGAASASAAGASGLVPTPAKGDQVHFLRGDATWVAPTVAVNFDEESTLISFSVVG